MTGNLLDQESLFFRVQRLEELAHQLSNTVGSTMNCLIQAATGKKKEFVDKVGCATDEAMRSTGTLRLLMWELQDLHKFVQNGNGPSPLIAGTLGMTKQHLD